MMLQGELGGEIGDDEAALNKADRTKNGTRGKVAVGAIDYFGADDQDRNIGTAQDGFSNGADENFSDGAGRMGAHDDAVDVALAQISEDLVSSKAWAHHYIALDASVASGL